MVEAHWQSKLTAPDGAALWQSVISSKVEQKNSQLIDDVMCQISKTVMFKYVPWKYFL